MFDWISKIFQKRYLDDDSQWVRNTSDELANLVMQVFALQFKHSGCAPSDIPQHKEFFVASYVAGFCDVMSQHYDARPGGSLSMTLSVQIMQKIFGNTHGEHMFRKVDEAMNSGSKTCFKASRSGRCKFVS